MHLSRYGRPITGDWYAAMKYGPVPSHTYSILKTLRGDENIQLPERANALKVVDPFYVRAKRAADEDVLSASEIACLKTSAAEHGAKTFNKLTAESHGRAWDAADENGMIKLENLLLDIENRDELRGFFSERRFLRDGSGETAPVRRAIAARRGDQTL